MTAQKSLKGYGSIEKFIIVWGLITAEEHDEFAGWYPKAQTEVFDLAATYGLDRFVACQVVSAVSPAVDWNVNVRYAARTIEAWQGFKEEVDRLAYFKEHRVGAPYGWDNFRKAWRILDGDQEIIHKGSPKTYRFARNIFTPRVTRLATVDSKMARQWRGSVVAQSGSVQITDRQYLHCERDIITLADTLGIAVDSCQEELWQKQIRMVNTNTLPHELGIDW